MIVSPFNRNGVPYFVLAGQVHNSSAYSQAEMETAWKALEILKANTAEVPVYWEQIEPRRSQFNFSAVDQLVESARERSIRVVLLWFATWKNGSMQYAPEWVKKDPAAYPRVVTHAGNRLWVLSSHSQSNWEADCSAFCALLAHLKEIDPKQKVVAAVQIENEPGILGAVRDHSPAAEAEFRAAVPAELLQSLAAAGSGLVRAAWTASGKRDAGTWQQVFGPQAAEYFSAWSIARYIDRLAEAGKAVFNLPLYVNVWLGENGWRQPGISYPSGGPVTSVLDLWKWATPHIDLIAPDIYIDTPDTYRQVCLAYSRTDNPLFIPESGGSPGNALNIFEAIATHKAVGYGIFGIESLLAADGSVKPQHKALVESCQIVSNVQLLFIQFWNTGRMHAVIQREFMSEQLLDLGEYLALIHFANHGPYHTDFRNNPADPAQRGRGLIFVDKGRELYMAGTGFTVLLKRKRAEEADFSKAHDRYDGPLSPYLRVEEGHYSPMGEFITDHVRNGDEITAGLWLTTDIGVLRVRMAE